MKKGVSPLVASVLLIVIVVSLVALISGWITSFFTGTRETITNRTDTSVGCTGASAEIESVYILPGNTTGVVIAVVRNNGLLDTNNIVAAQVYNTTGSNFSSSTALPITDFSRGAIKTIRFENASLTNCSVFSHVIVSTKCPPASTKRVADNC